ncbi:MAG: ABC transporter permease [Burkholderiaceae bacterium]|jgi:ABC-2 type transport system permease protein|nr:ABC transporter permease [Burkholderiaceae bacterium]
MNGFATRLLALTRKEVRQLLRDKSNLAIGILLPLLLIALFGWGLSLDVKNAPIAAVLDDSSPAAVDALAALELTPVFSVRRVRSMHEAEQLMRARQVDGIVRFSSDFSRQLAAGDARIQLIVHGADAGRASIVAGYAQAALAGWGQKQADRTGFAQARLTGPASGAVAIEQRMWFNAANTSTWYLVPGLVVLIMTLVGAFLTALVVAREWERGTFEALFVSPVRPVEILLAKIIPYFAVGMIGLAMCLVAARWVFGVPLYGSLAVLLTAAMLYMLVSVGIGLLISSLTKNQFIASQMALLISFLPALMLSGFLFDLRNVPLPIQVIGHVMPATYYMELIRTLFLAGDLWPMIFKNCAILLAYALVLLGLALRVTRKNLE